MLCWYHRLCPADCHTEHQHEGAQAGHLESTIGVINNVAVVAGTSEDTMFRLEVISLLAYHDTDWSLQRWCLGNLGSSHVLDRQPSIYVLSTTTTTCNESQLISVYVVLTLHRYCSFRLISPIIGLQEGSFQQLLTEVRRSFVRSQDITDLQFYHV